LNLSSSAWKLYSFVACLLINVKLILDLLNSFYCNVRTALFTVGISFLTSSVIGIVSKPTLKLFFTLPLKRTPAIMSFSMVFSFASFAMPILLEKKGLESLLLLKSVKRPLFSIKNCLLAGKEISKCVRSISYWSIATCEKSGFTVTSKFRLLPMVNFVSPPNFKAVFETPFLKYLEVIVII
jgi:hypothetical protein